MKKSDFKIIKGGTLEGQEPAKRVFVSAYVTDTRLMGAVVLYAHWKLIGGTVSDHHQFFYYDPEDEGIETYKSVPNNDINEIKAVENSLLSGLGSNRVHISEKEFRYLFIHYSQTNLALNKPFPDLKEDYEFLFDNSYIEEMSEEEKLGIVNKTIVSLISENHSINYFLMRAFAHDEEALNFFINKSCKLQDYLKLPKSDLCKNSIEIFTDEKGSSFLCESLIESNNQYRITISEIKLGKNFKVKYAKILSSFYVSTAEAAMLMAKPEYVTCYDIIDCDGAFSNGPSNQFMEYFYQFVKGSLSTEHDDGSLFIVFNNNNMHVNRSEYKMNDDLYCIYYISNFDQLIVTAYNPHVISRIEISLEKSKLGQYLLPLSKYQFKEPMVYEFIQSDFEDFEEFVEAMLCIDGMDGDE